MSQLLVIVPTRSRPEAVGRVVEAWHATGAFDDGAELMFVWDRDDPRAEDYVRAYDILGWSEARRCRFRSISEWRPMVPKLNAVALDYALRGGYFALGFAGDDHLPRTPGWAGRYIETLHAAGTGIVSCADGYRTDELPTQWAMTADIVRALGRMVPAPVDHLYCDDAVRDLGKAAQCFTYLHDVLIEHMHPVAQKAASDAQYERVNGREQYRADGAAYRTWRRRALPDDAAKIRALMAGKVVA